MMSAQQGREVGEVLPLVGQRDAPIIRDDLWRVRRPHAVQGFATCVSHNGRMSTLPHPSDASDLAPLPALPTGPYVHYKGGRYEVLGVARHSETHEALVVYRPLYGEGALWVRPFEMFVEDVVIDGVRQPRFRWTGAAPAVP